MRILGKSIIFVLIALILVLVVNNYVFTPLGDAVHPEMKRAFEAHPVGIYAHISAGAIALLLGPFQFLTRLRQRWPGLHRGIGRVYLGVGVLIGGSAGLYMSQYAFGGPIARIGFALLAVLWLFSGWKALAAIRRGDIVRHREWMVRNFSLTFAGVMLRLWLMGSFIAQIRFEESYHYIAWLCWVPNLIFAQCQITLGRRNA
jgi:uncharacterized membrane protein